MSAQNSADDELAPSQTQGYKVGQERSLAELSQLDKEDESLQRWKASLGLNADNATTFGPKKVVPIALFLEAATLNKTVSLDLTLGKEGLAKYKKEPITIKEGAEFSVGIKFRVENQIVSGMKYLQVVKRTGMTVDKMEEMIGSFGPQKEPYTKIFAAEEAPSGMLARGTYGVRSRMIDDDATVFLDFEWSFKIAKEW
ncbi:rho GDP dissociation inhibitor [Naganishia albida]|nr:rho GDP dissociation inhibitor [Naganishia albida]